MGGLYDGCHVVHGRVACACPKVAYLSLFPTAMPVGQESSTMTV